MDRAREWGIPVILADRKAFGMIRKKLFEAYILDAIALINRRHRLAGPMRPLERRFHLPL